MHVSRLEVRDFRSHQRAELELSGGITVLEGPVGAGKTNLMEAVHVGCTGRSFRTSNERELIRFGQGTARVRLRIAAAGAEHTTEVVLQSRGPKSVQRDGTRVTHPQAGDPPFFVCVFAPDHLELVKGPGGMRRALLDDLTATVWPARRGTRASYAKALAQRNALLGRVRARAVGPESLHVWDRELARHGVELMDHRRELVEALSEPFTRRAAELGLPAPATLEYRPRSEARSSDALELELRERLDADLERGFTLHGPHRDDLVLRAGTRDLRRYGSQGQQRLGLLSLLLAERDVLTAMRATHPVMLLDDVLSELDPERRERLLQTLAGPGQALISTADARTLPADVDAARVQVRPPAAAGEQDRAEEIA
ncbi:MAG TPA: DNA replication and repair protein RecF [Solirubrobacterales bacterium]|nr:DNA replication and repair protein RecF [Solirubrobacterales bacterium]